MNLERYFRRSCEKAMKETALERVARALDLIPFISQNPGLSVVEIADRFHSTPTQISKDLSLLHMCGLPGYSHLELLDIDYEDPRYVAVRDAQVLNRPRTFSQIEVLTLVLGLNMLEEVATSDSEGTAISNLRDRFSGILNEEISRTVSIADGLVDSPLATEISGAITRFQFVTMEYVSASSDSRSAKEVYPLEIYFNDGIGYFTGYALDVDALRTFRIDRIVSLKLGEINLKFMESVGNVQSDEIMIEMELLTGKDGIFFIEKHNEIVTSFEETADGFQIYLKVSPGEWIIRTLLSWQSKVTVVRPESLAFTLRARIASALKNYE